MTLKSFGSLALTSVMFISLLAACSSTGSSNGSSDPQNSQAQTSSASSRSEPAKADSKDKISLRFVTSEEQNSPMYKALKSLVDAYNTSNQNVSVNLENIPYDTFTDKLTAQIIGGRAPDAGVLLDRWATAMVAQNALLPVSDFVDKSYANEFNPNSWNYAVVNGKAYAIPLYANVQALLYNKDLLDKAGIQVPTDPKDAWHFDDLVKAAKSVQAKTGVKYGFAHWVASTPSRLSQYLVADGGSVLSPDFKSVTLDNPAGIEMFKKINQTFKDGVVPPDNWTATGNPNPIQMMFVNQQVAMFVASGNFQTVFLDQNIGNKFKWGFTYMPTTLGTPIELVGFQQTKHPKEVMAFLQYMASSDNMAKIAVEANAVPTRVNISGDTLKYQIAPDSMKFLMSQIKLANSQIQGEMQQPYWSEIDLMLRKKLELMSLGQLTPEQAANEGAKEARNIIAKYNK